ncbi:MAG: 1-acyl-sn-glycerol-3-phosphate acyltransferase [Candidatus Hydrogenedentes bacterium]|nr:1-acyl-sn-glycerol-3-phosphate acyltransferase [Candidatus Hydrogenedentota bacterium]
MQASRAKIRTHYPPWLRAFAGGILRLLGWKLEGKRPDAAKFLVIAAPHSTNWDLPAMLLCSTALDIPCVFMMKDTVFWGPLGALWRWLGGVAVNRRASSNMVSQVVDIVKERESIFLLIAPEGTRKHVDNVWKLGFYWIATGAEIPLLLSFVDYKHKRVGVGPLVHLTGGLEADFAQIRSFYEPKMGIVPSFRERDAERHRQLSVQSQERQNGNTPNEDET